MLISQLKQAVFVVSIAAFVMLTNLGGPRLWDRDEPRNAECAREMLMRHDWVVPWFNGELRAHKPVLLYWCIMASYSALGISEFSARFPSALCAIGTTLCVYWIGRRLFGLKAGVWAGIALATSLMFVVAGRAATPDSLLIFCTTLSLAIYVRGTFRARFDTTPLDALPQLLVPGRHFPQHWPTVVAMYAAMGLGVLAKGPVGILLPTAVIGMFLLLTKLPTRSKTSSAWNSFDFLQRLVSPFAPIRFLSACWMMRPFTAIFAVAAVALPWYWAVGLATNGEFLKTFFLEHNLGRATATMEHHSGSSLFFYPLTILIGFFPWSIFALPLAIDTVMQLRRRDRFHPGYLLAACWIGVYVALFSLARTKLPSYVTPCYPALALLGGDYIDRWSRHAGAVAGRWLLASFACLALVGVAVAVFVPLAAKQLLPGEEWLGLIGLVPLAGGCACLGLVIARDLRAAAGGLGLTAVTFATLLFAVGTDRVDRHQANHLLFQAIHARTPSPQLAAYKVLEPSWVFYGGHPIHEFIPAPQDPKNQLLVAQAHDFLLNPNAYLITTEQRLRELLPAMPPEVQVLTTIPYFLKSNERLVLLGHTTTPGMHFMRAEADPQPKLR